MKRIIFILFLFSIASVSYGQINFQDSSVQVISYWELGEEYEYSISLQKLFFTDSDTTRNVTTTYDVNVSVIDSTDNSYTIRWFYKNFTSDAKNPIVKLLVGAAEDIAIDIKTDEYGVIQSIENWEEVMDYMTKSYSVLSDSIGDQDKAQLLLGQLKNMYSTKSTTEQNAIKDARQFHHFHGAGLNLQDTITTQSSSSSFFNGVVPIESDIIVVLESLDSEYNEYFIRSFQLYDSEQLTEVSYNYLKNIAEKVDEDFPTKEEFPEMGVSVETASKIHNTG